MLRRTGILFLIAVMFCGPGISQPRNDDSISIPGNASFIRYLKENLPAKEELDLFVRGKGWVKYDVESGYTLNNSLTFEEYLKRYFIGHYNPAGNHFFAFAIKDRMVEWLEPKPITYQEMDKASIEFTGYLEGMKH